jgi:outer membrane protein assembly factor BamB
VFLLSRIGSQEAVTAYELATGTQVWRQTYDAPYEMNPAAVGHGKGPKSTPVVSGGRVYTFGISGILSAFDAASGRVIWRTDFRSRFPSASPEFGTAMSPIVTGGLVIVHAGGNGKGAVVAFDEKKGDAVRWTWTGDGPAYSSPVVALVDGVRLLVTQTQSRVVALSLADGRLAWDVPFTTDYDQNIVTPVVQDDVVIYSGLSKPLTAVRVARAGGKWQTTRLWQNPELPMYMSSPVAANGLLFGLTHRNRGQFFCADARTGRTLWVTRGREGENAALVVAGGLLLAATTEGELVVARPSATSFDVVKRYTVAESPVWAHPVPTGSGVLIKDAETLALWTF